MDDLVVPPADALSARPPLVRNDEVIDPVDRRKVGKVQADQPAMVCPATARNRFEQTWDAAVEELAIESWSAHGRGRGGRVMRAARCHLTWRGSRRCAALRVTAAATRRIGS